MLSSPHLVRKREQGHHTEQCHKRCDFRPFGTRGHAARIVCVSINNRDDAPRPTKVAQASAAQGEPTLQVLSNIEKIERQCDVGETRCVHQLFQVDTFEPSTLAGQLTIDARAQRLPAERTTVRKTGYKCNEQARERVDELQHS